MGFVDWTRGELLEIVMQILFFNGVPNALNGLKIVKEVLRKEITKELKIIVIGFFYFINWFINVVLVLILCFNLFF